jgi:D-sedoheptulose 7-phosphate isomerase
LHSITDSESYFSVLAGTMRDLFHPCVDRIAAELLRAYDEGNCVFVFGNGGSAATASHFACDLGKSTSQRLPNGARRFRVIALTDNAPLLTAWANDSSFEDIFAEQLRNLVKPGDVVMAISASGNSANVLKALELGLREGAYTVGLAGFRGGKMKPLCHTCLVVPSKCTEVIEDVHMATCHALARVVRHALEDIHNPGVEQRMSCTLPDPCSVSVTAIMNAQAEHIHDVGLPSRLPGAAYEQLQSEPGQTGD